MIMMMILETMSVILIFAASNYQLTIDSVDCALPFTLADGYWQVNDYLRGFVRLREATDFFNILEREANEIKNRRSFIGVKEFFKNHHNYKSALNNLLTLELVIREEPRCNIVEFERLKQAAKYSDGHKFVPEYRIKSLTPLDLIVHTVGLAHAEGCKKYWLQQFKQVYLADTNTSNGESEMVDWAEFVRPTLVSSGKSAEESSIEQYTKWLVEFEKTLDPQNSKYELAAKHIVLHSKNDSQRCKFSRVYNKYLRKPCKAYDEKYGKPILNQANFGSQMYENQVLPLADNDSTQEDKAELVKFYQAIVHARLCREILTNSKDFKAKVKLALIVINGATLCANALPV